MPEKLCLGQEALEFAICEEQSAEASFETPDCKACNLCVKAVGRQLLLLGDVVSMLDTQREEANREKERADIQFEELKGVAYTDHKTGLGNSRYLEYKFSEFAKEHSRFGMLFIDIANFKKVNDMRGHTYGDIVLRETAEFLTESIRGKDDAVACREGGDEFIILISFEQRDENSFGKPEDEQTKLDKVAKRLADQFINTDFAGEHNNELSDIDKMRLRIGSSIYSPGLSFDQFKSMADPKKQPTVRK